MAGAETDRSGAPPSLARLYLRRALGEERDDAALDLALRTAIEGARHAHPTIGVTDEVFVEYLAERTEAADDAAATLPKLCVDDLLVACGALASDRRALEAFDKHYLSVVGPAIMRIDPSQAFRDEVVQHMRVGLLVPRDEQAARLANYRGLGRLGSWIKVAAVRAALEMKKGTRREDSLDDELMDAGELDDDAELAHIRQMYRAEFSVAFREALRTLTSRERNILRMYVMDGLNIDQIGAIYRVHRATIARWIAKAREQLLAETRSRLVDKLRLTETQFESLMHVVRSHLDLSLERFLKDVSKGA